MSQPNACFWMARNEKLEAWRLALKWSQALFFLSQFDCAPLKRKAHAEYRPRRRKPQQFIFLFLLPNRSYQVKLRIVKALRGKVPHITPAPWCYHHPTVYKGLRMRTVMATARDWCNVWHLVMLMVWCVTPCDVVGVIRDTWDSWYRFF